MKLFFGTIPMLLVAGFIEGFVSPSNLPVTLKFSLATVLFLMLVLYLFRAGREASPANGPKPTDLVAAPK